MSRKGAVDAVLLIVGAILILQFLGGIAYLSFFAGLMLVAPFGVVGGALMFVVYYRRKNRKLEQHAIETQRTNLTVISSFPSSAEAKMRPTAATFLAVTPVVLGAYSLIISVFCLLLTMVVFVASSEQLETFREEVFGELDPWSDSQQSLQMFLSALTGLFLALGVASMVSAYGLLKGREWSWSLAIALATSAIILEIALGSLVPDPPTSRAQGPDIPPIMIIAGGFMLYLLFRSDVKSFLRRNR